MNAFGIDTDTLDQWLSAYAHSIVRACDPTEPPERRWEARQRAWFIAHVLEIVH